MCMPSLAWIFSYVYTFREMDPLEHLKIFGYTLIPKVLDPKECHQISKRLSELHDSQKLKGLHGITVNMPHLEDPQTFLPYTNKPKVLRFVRSVLGDDCILMAISGFQSALEGGSRPHIDSRIPLTGIENTTNLFCMIALEEFTDQNGATIVWPQSHRSGIDPRAFRDQMQIPGGVSIQCQPGDMLVMIMSTWHDVGPNLSGQSRWGLGVQYCRWWHKPGFDFRKCGPEIFKMLSPEQKHLFGFTSQPPRSHAESVYTIISSDQVPERYDDAIQGLRQPS